MATFEPAAKWVDETLEQQNEPTVDVQPALLDQILARKREQDRKHCARAQVDETHMKESKHCSMCKAWLSN